MKNPINELFSNMGDAELLEGILEIKTTDKLGFIKENSILRKYTKIFKECPNYLSSNDTMTLMDVQVHFMKEAAFRWVQYINTYNQENQIK